MAIEIKMPDLSQTTDEVRFIKWLVAEGDRVKKGDILCEVETDKVNMEVESFAEGMVLKLNAEPDQQIKTGTVIAIVGEKNEFEGSINIGEDKGSLKEDTVDLENRQKEDVAPENDINPEKNSTKARATMLVQKLAEKKGINLAEITGTGPGGTITREDIENYIDNKKRI
ncbi:MAG: E3 binding domain-containing protein [Actinobacteria bacterium]|nr:E3 binding domain-containing protein [Actinomycetota bacterium]